MLTALKFVQGAVSKKEFIPAITHFCIQDGRINAFNGTITLSGPVACDLDCKPKAVPMVKAIANCGDTITLSMTPAGRLTIRSGPFRAHIECTTEEHPYSDPEGDFVDVDGEVLLAGLETVKPFIGTDASRPWSTGVLYRGKSLYATNNVCLVEYWMGTETPVAINIPRQAILEMLRIGEPPTRAQISANSVTFFYTEERWLKTTLYSTEWPDMERILAVDSQPLPLADTLFEAVATLKPFMNKLGQMFITGGLAHTHVDISEGASYHIEGWPHGDSVWALEMVAMLKGVATTADLSLYPGACPFFGDRLRGAIIGMKLPE